MWNPSGFDPTSPFLCPPSWEVLLGTKTEVKGEIAVDDFFPLRDGGLRNTNSASVTQTYMNLLPGEWKVGSPKSNLQPWQVSLPSRGCGLPGCGPVFLAAYAGQFFLLPGSSWAPRCYRDPERLDCTARLPGLELDFILSLFHLYKLMQTVSLISHCLPLGMSWGPKEQTPMWSFRGRPDLCQTLYKYEWEPTRSLFEIHKGEVLCLQIRGS